MPFGALGELAGGIAGLFTEGGMDRYNAAVNALQAVQSPDFSLRDLPAPQLQLVAEFFPEEYNAVLAREEAALPEESPVVRGRQLESLRALEDIQREGLPLAERLQAQDLQRQVAQETGRAQEGILRSLAERGRLGGGEEIAARMQGSQIAADLSRGLGSDLARQAVLNRLAATGQAGELAGRIRAQDIGLSQARADALNRFNEFASTLLTGAQQYGAGARERAQAYNVGTRQRIAEQNPLLRYQTQVANLQRQNQLEAQRRAFDLSRAQAEAAAQQQAGLAGYAEQQRQIDALRGLGRGAGELAGVGFGMASMGPENYLTQYMRSNQPQFNFYGGTS